MSVANGEAEAFQERNRMMIERLGGEEELRELSRRWLQETAAYEYSYHFTWLGRPIIQYPQDIVALQEIIWQVKPTTIVETGIAHGGSLVLSASLLELLGGEERRVLGIDIEIREHNRVAIETHPLAHRIAMIEGSSTDEAVISQVRDFVGDTSPVLVVLDSSHTHEHVLRELELYSPFVTLGSYLVVFDTAVELMPEDSFPDRPWRKGANPYTAVQEFLAESDRFEIDTHYDDKLLVSVAPSGYLRCVR
jgi:cephalosporin hydroxylase